MPREKKISPPQSSDSALSARTPLTRDRVLHAAINLADEGGISALSMRKLAQALGVEAMSLYNHVANKEDMLDGMVDLVAAKMSVPDIEANWKVEMRERTTSAHRVLLNHPWANILFVSRMNMGPSILRHIDATHGCLRKAGFSHPMADHARNVLDSHLYGFTLQQIHFPIAEHAYADSAKHFLFMLPVERYPHMRALTEEVIDGRYNGLHQVEFGLDLILDGLEKLLEKTA